MSGRRTALLFALASGLAVAPLAQSLGDAARRERERRAKEGTPKAPSFGDADLEAFRSEGTPAAAASPSPKSSPDAAPRAGPSPAAEDESAVRKRQEAEWRVRFANARERVARAREAAWHEVVETNYVSGIPVQQRVRKYEETEEVRQAQRALADLEEEFRRTGLPPGWARE